MTESMIDDNWFDREGPAEQLMAQLRDAESKARAAIDTIKGAGGVMVPITVNLDYAWSIVVDKTLALIQERDPGLRAEKVVELATATFEFGSEKLVISMSQIAMAARRKAASGAKPAALNAAMQEVYELVDHAGVAQISLLDICTVAIPDRDWTLLSSLPIRRKQMAQAVAATAELLLTQPGPDAGFD